MAAAVVVGGHTKCGGVEAAWLTSREPFIPTDTPLDRWLVSLINLSKELGLNRLPIEDKNKALRILTEENARRQVHHIFNLRTVQEAWNRGQKVSLHAWVFQMETGTLVDNAHGSTPQISPPPAVPASPTSRTFYIRTRATPCPAL
ncbi:hypothetical protein C8J57DRAFT_1504234 [Mycena rebaudengoi]|nr:hypothetical protein C8J57DRAFT_1504234 [Mycena rebaudengoi]